MKIIHKDQEGQRTGKNKKKTGGIIADEGRNTGKNKNQFLVNVIVDVGLVVPVVTAEKVGN